MADGDSDEREKRSSEIPADLGRERDSFVRQFLRKGVELTENLLEENKELHKKLAESQQQIARLMAQIASDDAIRDFVRTIDKLEDERKALLEKSTELEDETRRTEHRNEEIEQELHDLANLYIASSHLHSTLSIRGVVKHLKELCQQLVGAEIYAIYLMQGDGTRAEPLACDGVDMASLTPVIKGEGPVGDVLMTGVPRVIEHVQARGTLETPVAVIPLMVRDEAVGAIVIASVFEQKDVWAPVDQELFKLLGSHAATALIAANLYSTAGGALPALDGVIDSLNKTS